MLPTHLRNERGQTTMEWLVLSVLIAMTMIVIGLTMGEGLMAIWEALAAKIGGFLSSITL